MSPRLSPSPTASTSEATRPAVLERHGGWLVSGALHGALFAVLFAWQIPPLLEKPQAREMIRVVLSEAPTPIATPQPAMAALTAEPTPLAAGAVAAAEEAVTETAAGEPMGPESIQENPAAAETAELAPVPRATPRPAKRIVEKAPEVIAPVEPPAIEAPVMAGPPEANPDLTLPQPVSDGNEHGGEIAPEEAAMLEQIRQGAAAQHENNATQGARGSSDVAQQLRLHHVDVKAKQLLFNSRGVEEGAIRELDITGLPEAEARQVLERYGIRILAGLAPGGQKTGAGFLSAAKTAGGRYTNVDGAAGPVEIFQYGPMAIQRMMQLEEEALAAQGHSPATARVVRVVFGVVPTSQGYDLAVKRLEATALPKGEAAGPDQKPFGVMWEGLAGESRKQP